MPAYRLLWLMFSKESKCPTRKRHGAEMSPLKGMAFVCPEPRFIFSNILIFHWFLLPQRPVKFS